jgi:protease PrsW
MKLSITLQNGSLVGKTFDITDGFLTFGRGDKCNVKFAPDERIVSSNHAYIQFIADGFYLVDNNSTNGSFVNGERIQKIKLSSGDKIGFGKNGVESVVQILSPQVEKLNPNFHIPPINQVFNQPKPAESVMNSMSYIGLHNNNVDKQPKSQTGKYIGFAVAIFSVVFLSLIVMLLVGSSIGIGTAIVASIVAFTPAVLYILPLVWLDRYDPEPVWLLALAFAWGALVAVIFSATANDIMGAIFGKEVATVISAPIFEEGSKGFGLLLLLVFFRREFDDILDGIIYGGVIALGFATVENVLYYGRGMNEGGGKALLVLFVLRGIMSPFAHVTFTSMTGIGCGISRESHKTVVRILLPLVGYCCAVALHAIWNGMAVIGGLEGFITGYLILEIPFFLIFVGFAIFVMRRQSKILKDSLAIDVARGLITQDQLNIVTSAFRSFIWTLNSKFIARRAFIRSVGKLGLSYWHIQRATAAQGQTGSFQQNPILRDEVLQWKDKI